VDKCVAIYLFTVYSFVLFITHAGVIAAGVGRAFGRVCMCVCMHVCSFVCPRSKRKTA